MIAEPLLKKACLTSGLKEKFSYLWQLVGNTPMLEINFYYKGRRRKIYVKCEQFNLTGSIKDRMALYTLHQSYYNCLIRPEDTIVEATSGNTGIAFSAIGRVLGHHVEIIMPDWLSKERVDIIKSLGAKIRLVSKEEGGFQGSIALAEEDLKSRRGIFLPRQFENQFNLEAHEVTTGTEIIAQLEQVGLKPDAFVAGVGTGGTVMGVGRKLRVKNPNVKVHPLEPFESPTLSTGFKVGSHRIQGISDEFIPNIVKLNQLDTVVKAHDGDAIIVAQKLAAELGLAVGISSGANFIGALRLLEQLGDDATVVTIFPDCNKKYLSTDLMKVEPAREEYISTELKFEGFKSLGRITESDGFRFDLVSD
jgi:cysteine synthase A